MITGEKTTASHTEEHNNVLGVLCVLGAATTFTFNDMLVKLLSTSYPLHQITFVRSVIGLLVALAIFVPLEGGFSNLRTRRFHLHLFRGAMLVMTNMFFFLALAAMPLGEATATFFVAPILITLLSVLMLGEKIGGRRIVAVCAGLAGVFLIVRPGTQSFQIAAMLPLLAALCYALIQITTRKLGIAEKASTTAFYSQLIFLLFSGLMGLAVGDGKYAGSPDPSLSFLLRAWAWPHAEDLALMALIGVTIGLGAYLISQAYRLAEAGFAAPFEYVSMPIAIVLGIIVWGEWPDAIAWMGMLLIAFSGLYVFLREALLGRKSGWKERLPPSR